METEKIKTAEEILKSETRLYEAKIIHAGKGVAWDIAIKQVIKAMEEYASQFKQPPVSVMPSDEEIENVFNEFIHNVSNWYGPTQQDFEKAINKLLSLSKEAPKEQACENCNGSGAVKIGHEEYSECPCVKKQDKESTKERMPDVGETIKKRHIGHDKIIKIIRNNSGYEYVTGQGIFANDVRIHKVAKEVVDLFKQRNK